jgi:hypothetical protein
LSDSCTHALLAVSRIFWYYLCSVWRLFGVLFAICYCIFVSSCHYLDVMLFENCQGYKEEDSEHQGGGERQVILEHVEPMLFLSLVYTIGYMH